MHGKELLMTTPSDNLRYDAASEIKSRAGWGIFLGVLTVAFGLLLIAYPLFTAALTVFFLGGTLIVVGILDIVRAFRAHTGGSFFLRLLLGVVYGAAGVFLVLYPLSGVVLLTVVLGLTLLAESVMGAVLAFQMDAASGRGWMLFEAAITAILGVMILARWPVSSLWAIGTLVGAAVLVRGITRIALSATLRSVAGRVEDSDNRRPRAA
jgi:uncharacterized membrane protein HdeD (DUF308 family)